MYEKHFVPACLQLDDEFLGTSVLSMGWGRTSYQGKQSDVLLKFPLELVSNKECNEYYEDHPSLPDGIIASQICAWDPKGKIDTCEGDSGLKD